jgi:GT2 family glycosyltransferase
MKFARPRGPAFRTARMNQNETPLISVLIPCYNAQQWVGQAIESALAQTWPRKEVIVVDDGSTDGSLEKIRSFGTAIRYETGPNRGGNAARNRLWSLAAGDWLQYLDADDYLLPEKIERQFAEMGEPSTVDVGYSPMVLEDWNDGRPNGRETREINSGDLWVNLVKWILPQTGAALWRRSAIGDVGGWKDEQPCCQEHELYLRLLSAGKSFRLCPTPGAVYRQWSAETVCRKDPLRTVLTRSAIVDAAERHLQERDALNQERRDAITDARYECARNIYHLDRLTARKIAETARRSNPTHRLPRTSRFPLTYRCVYRIAGFEAAERIAEIVRPWRS